MRHVHMLNGTDEAELNPVQHTKTFTILERSTQNEIQNQQGTLKIQQPKIYHYH